VYVCIGDKVVEPQISLHKNLRKLYYLVIMALTM